MPITIQGVEYLTLNDAARITAAENIGIGTAGGLSAWIKRGALTATADTAGKLTLIARADLDAFIESRRGKPIDKGGRPRKKGLIP